MKTCPTCQGRGEVLTPGWFWIQLYELGGWSDYLDYATLTEAVAKTATLPQWTDKIRIQQRGKTVWPSPTPRLATKGTV